MDYSVFAQSNPGTDYPVKDAAMRAQLSLDSDKIDSASSGYGFGYKRNTTAGLNVGYYGGVINSGGVLTTVADSIIALTASQTNYVERTAAGVVSKNTAGFTAGKIPMFTATTNTTDITAIVDKKQGNVFGELVAVAGISSGSVGGTLGSLSLYGTTAGSATLTVDANVTKVTLNKPLDLGANALTAGPLSVTTGAFSSRVTLDMNSGIGSAPLTAAAGGGTCSFVCNDANGYLVIITSTNDNLTGKSGAYYFRGMNKQIGQNKDPLVCELGTLNAPTWAFSYALQGTYNCTVTITTGVEAVAVQIIPLGVL